MLSVKSPVYYFGIITVSTSRYYDKNKEDKSGLLASAMIRNYGHKVCCRRLVPDDKLAIISSITGLLLSYKPDALVLIGGTGPSKTDFTDEAVRSLSEKLLYGLSEEFRRRSYEKLGSAGLLGNMTVGLLGDSAILALPGSPDAVEEGLKIFMESLHHIIGVRRGLGHERNNVG